MIGSVPVLPEKISLRFGDEKFEVEVVLEGPVGRSCGVPTGSVEVSARYRSPTRKSGLEDVRLRWNRGKQKIFEEGGPSNLRLPVGPSERPIIPLTSASETMSDMDSVFLAEEDRLTTASPGFVQDGAVVSSMTELVRAKWRCPQSQSLPVGPLKSMESLDVRWVFASSGAECLGRVWDGRLIGDKTPLGEFVGLRLRSDGGMGVVLSAFSSRQEKTLLRLLSSFSAPISNCLDHGLRDWGGPQAQAVQNNFSAGVLDNLGAPFQSPIPLVPRVDFQALEKESDPSTDEEVARQEEENILASVFSVAEAINLQLEESHSKDRKAVETSAKEVLK
ncbi:hypothetical protein LINPERPRIM_LOCUS947 [Linum perenne]